MDDKVSESLAQRIYRIDKFEVPEGARDEFVTKVRETHKLLHTLPGFLQDFLLEQSTGQGIVKIVTIVEWENASAVENAQQAVQAHRAKTQFNPQDLLTRLGIKADLGNYTHMSA